MAEKIGRLGYLGLAIEASQGVAENTPDVFIPFTENSLRGHHEPIMDNAVRTSRIKDGGSVAGKKWGEGTVSMYLDANNCGYLLKMALGLEVNTTKNSSPNVNDHLFTPTVSGNLPTTATLWDNKGVDAELYTYAAIDSCEIEISNDGIATINGSFISKAPSTTTAPTLTVPSGTLFTWKDLNLRFGTTTQTALVATPTKVTNVKFQIANAVEAIYKSGSNNPDTIMLGTLEVTGSFSMYFESVTERDNYYNLNKQTMIMSLTGAGLGAGYTEQLQVVFKKIVYEDIDMETGVDDYFAITCNFRAELDRSQAGFVEATLRNNKTTDYS